MRVQHWVLATAFAAAGALGARPALAQTGFNGVITFVQTNDEGKQTTFVQSSKGRKVRFDGMSGDSGSMILDGDAKVMMMVEPKKQQVMVMTEEDAKQMAAMMGPMMDQMKKKQGADTAGGKLKFTNTGRTETVAGVRCEVWHGTYSTGDEDREGDACIAKGVGLALAEMTYENPMVQRGGAGWNQMQQYRSLVGENKGILKVVRTKDGKQTTELEATKIDRTVPSDDAFKPPPGYKEIRMGDMMRQAHEAMQGMQHGQGNPGQGNPDQGQGQPQHGQPAPSQGQGNPPAKPKPY